MQDLKYIIESLLFASDEPLSIDKLKAIVEDADGKQIRQTLEDLVKEYDLRGGGFHLREVAGGWQLRSRPAYNDWIKKMLQPSPQRLSKAALETLAIIAYKQPIIRADIEHIRGVDSGGVLRQLMERKLIRVLGRKEIAGRPLIYATTKLFLELFDLKDLNDLPTPKEIQELSEELRRPQHAAQRQADEIAAHENNRPETPDDPRTDVYPREEVFEDKDDSAAPTPETDAAAVTNTQPSFPSEADQGDEQDEDDIPTD